MTAGGDERSGGPWRRRGQPQPNLNTLFPRIPSATQFTAAATRCIHGRGCKAVSLAARESVTALAVEEMKERKGGPRQKRGHVCFGHDGWFSMVGCDG